MDTTRKYSSLADWLEDFKSKGYYADWSDFILHSVLSFEIRDLTDIYGAIRKRYPDICVDYIIYWDNPKWKHMVRSVLDRLMKEGFAKSVSRGRWVRLK